MKFKLGVLVVANSNIRPHFRTYSISYERRILPILNYLRKNGYVEFEEYIPCVQKVHDFIKEIKRGYDIVIIHRIQGDHKTYVNKNYLAAIKYLKANKAKYIFDFDDAIYINYPLLFDYVVSCASAVVTCSPMNILRINKLRKPVEVIFTPVPESYYRIQHKYSEDVAVFHGTWIPNLKEVIPNLVDVGINKLVIVSNLFKREKTTNLRLNNRSIRIYVHSYVPPDKLPYLYKQYNASLGLYPLPSSKYFCGKCAAKVFEYLALGMHVYVKNPCDASLWLIDNVCVSQIPKPGVDPICREKSKIASIEYTSKKYLQLILKVLKQ